MQTTSTTQTTQQLKQLQQFNNLNNSNKSALYGRPRPRYEIIQHEPDQRQGYPTGDGGEEVFVFKRTAVSVI